MRILALNSGSSSIKFCVFNMRDESLQITGKIERIGESNSNIVYRKYSATNEPEEFKNSLPPLDHAQALKHIFELPGISQKQNQIGQLSAIGHRVVHGGDRFQYSALIDDDVINRIQSMTSLAPLHNAANLMGIKATIELFPNIPQVAVFDSAFFHSLPPHAYRYALPESMLKHHIRRYGFHGISHKYVAGQAAEKYLDQPLETQRIITLHLGNGASATAISNGDCVDTSMGMTPLEGLIMGTRCGDIDPSIHFYLARSLGMDMNDIETLLNHESGMKGLCGFSDMREIHRLADGGDKQAQLAIEMYCYRIVKYVGAYYTVMGGLDALIFTAGIGEHDSVIRQTVCDNLSALGVKINPSRNQAINNSAGIISDESSSVKVLVVPTNEELEIARQTVAVINQ